MRALSVTVVFFACAASPRPEIAPVAATAEPAVVDASTRVPEASVAIADAAAEVEAAVAADVDAAPVYDRRRQRIVSDDACNADGDCTVTSFYDCCARCEGPIINPANARLLKARMAACKTKTCPPMHGDVLCGGRPLATDKHAFCVEHRCVAQ